ncbi:hypothetical protein ANCCAN_21579 [Ancylostoma caninum]|uniref:Uncharacterized protein n=1 Tax=Ancylostoma caninum TaxID=29170 RepID=A0A368FK55_ANCCA|nr:hypothetical protein ANCCAN_21579 [Ancylostoma caninum]
MTEPPPHRRAKELITGGSIADFANVTKISEMHKGVTSLFEENTETIVWDQQQKVLADPPKIPLFRVYSALLTFHGGLPNELSNIVGANSGGVCEGIFVGGVIEDQSTWSTMRYRKGDRVKVVVLLGEIGGIEEYNIVDALKDVRIA